MIRYWRKRDPVSASDPPPPDRGGFPWATLLLLLAFFGTLYVLHLIAR